MAKAKASPVRLYTDTRGHTLTVGTRVAFNYSGNVAIGVIEHITPGGEFHIRRETHITSSIYSSKPKNTLSAVKNAASLIAINEVEDVKKVSTKMRNQALEDFGNANKKLMIAIRDAWDLGDVHLTMEEMFGKDWAENLD